MHPSSLEASVCFEISILKEHRLHRQCISILYVPVRLIADDYLCFYKGHVTFLPVNVVFGKTTHIILYSLHRCNKNACSRQGTGTDRQRGSLTTQPYKKLCKALNGFIFLSLSKILLARYCNDMLKLI